MIIYRNDQLLSATMQMLEQSQTSFYRNKYHSTTLSDFENIPFLERSELVDAPPLDRLYIDENNIRFFGFSSGTTSGVPLVSPFGPVENYFFEPSLGLEIKRPLIVYPPLNKNYGASFIQQCHQARRPVTPVFGDYEKLPNSAVLANMTQCDAIYATPTIALALAPYLNKYYNLQNIKLVAIASELVTPSIWNRLKSVYPNALISNLYASSEVGQFLMYTVPSDEFLYKNQFNVITKAVTVLELINNELVITYTQNPAFPLIRYKTGDYFNLISAKGDDVILEMLGRENVDVVKAGGFEIRSQDVDVWVDAQMQDIHDYQLHIYENSNGSHSVELECVIQNGSTMDEAVVAILHKNFLKNFTISSGISLQTLIEKGVLQGQCKLSIAPQLSTVSAKRRVIVYHPYST
jgi:phenylacetate-coenzyme A ligase PaaK-like adenylate-forming protein